MKIKSIWYEFEEWADSYNEHDANFNVVFELSDSTKLCATIFISEMKKDIIISVIYDIIRTEKIYCVFLW